MLENKFSKPRSLFVKWAIVIFVMGLSFQAQAAESDRMTFDLGLSSGSIKGKTYTELDLGLNAYFMDYFVWRNAVWARFADQVDNIYGVDSSVRAIYSIGNSSGGFTTFAGPGFRVASRGDSAPFLEGGAVVKFAGIAIGAGLKSILNSWVHTNADNDTQFFLILAGGGTL